MQRNWHLYALFTIGGLSALIYEVMWTRAFSLVFGSSSQSAASVLAAYFGGMALGNWIGAKLDKCDRPLRLYGYCEITVGVTALIVLLWLWAYRLLYPSLYASLGGPGTPLNLVKMVLAIVSLGPPVVAMGATLPFMTRAMVTQAGHVAGRTSRLYALNTAGATLGAVIGGLLLPPTLGITLSIVLAAIVSVTIGLIACRLVSPFRMMQLEDLQLPTAGAETGGAKTELAPSAGHAHRHAEKKATPAAKARRPLPLPILFAAAVSGFGTLALEVLHVRLLSHRSDRSIYSFGLLLGVYLVCLAGGSFVVSLLGDRHKPWRLIGWTQTLAVVAILASPTVLLDLPGEWFFATSGRFSLHILQLSAGLLLVMAPPVILMGMVLPLTWKLAISSVGEVSYRVGTLTAVNTLAAVAGSVLAGFAIIPQLGVSGGIALIGAIYAVLAAVALYHAYNGGLRYTGGLLMIGVAVWVGSGSWELKLQRFKPGEELVRYIEGESANVAVLGLPRPNQSPGYYPGKQYQSLRLMINDHYHLGSTRAYPLEVRQGRLPLMLHPSPKNVCFVGVATGITLSAYLDFPSVEKVTAVELVPGVVESLPDFGPWSRLVSYDDQGRVVYEPRLHMIVDDGRNFLLGTPERFDVIIGDLFVPWSAGVANLFTVENFKLCKRRLAAGGIYVQWLPGYQLSVEDTRIITASFLKAFPDAVMYRNTFEPEYPALALVGYKDGPSMDCAAVRESARQLQNTSGPPAQVLGDPAGLPLLYLCGPKALRDWTAGASLNRDDRPIIEYSTSRNVQVLGPEAFAQPMNEFVRSLKPPVWCYEESPADAPPVADIFAAADAIHVGKMLRLAPDADDLSNKEKQFQAFLKASQLAPQVNFVAGAVNGFAGECFRRLDWPGRAKQLLEPLLSAAHPMPEILFSAAMVADQESESAQALSYLQRAIQESPGNVAFHQLLSKVLRDEQRWQEAEQQLRSLRKAAPNNWRFTLELAQTLHKQGRYSEVPPLLGVLQELARDEEVQVRALNYANQLGLGAYFHVGE